MAKDMVIIHLLVRAVKGFIAIWTVENVILHMSRILLLFNVIREDFLAYGTLFQRDLKEDNGNVFFFQIALQLHDIQ